MRMYRRLILTAALTLTCLWMPVAVAAQSQKPSTPHLEGDWKGTATKTICGQPSGTSDVEMFLLDEPYQDSTSQPAKGNVSGTLIVDENPSKVIALYQAPELKADTPAMTAPPNVKSPFTDYNFDFTAKDPFLGVGFYQTLSGTLWRKNLRCMNLGEQGEMLKVDLEKQ